MHPFYIFLIVLSSIIVLFFLVCYVCFRLPFFVSKKQRIRPEFDLPPGDYFLPYSKQLKEWMDAFESTPYEEVSIKSFDGLTLSARYYNNFENAPVEIMFHGYRGSAKRDLCGGLYRCLQLKRNALIVDQRASGKSQGKVITFGVKEQYDVLAWANFAYKKFGDSVPLILTGISMGASSIVLASSLDLPKTVVGAVADCGYSDGKEIIERVVSSLKLPPKLFFPFIKLGGLIFGGFNIDKCKPAEHAKHSKIPILFLHGDKDGLVPFEMSVANFNACASQKRLEIFEGADHGACYLLDPERYLKVLTEFEENHLII